MGEVRTTLWCNRCQRNTGHLRQTANHVVHLLVFLFTCGLWIIMWAIFAILAQSNPSHCVVCGAAYSRKEARKPLPKPPSEDPPQRNACW